MALALKAKAKELGADIVGLAPADPFPEASAYDRWVAGGLHGSMGYMAKNAESRRDLKAWYPEARSVLLCGFSYADNDQENARPGHGRVARYARLPDYHPQLKARLARLLDWLKSASPGADGRMFVDTSPILERLYARYAGMGWIGKNTMLIHPRRGSYFFLAGLALNLDLPHDEPGQKDHCGSCRRCLDACPTDAFPQERVLDAGRCISELTIERRGKIPEELREGTGDWIFGCDICQEVCPWNKFSTAGETFEPTVETFLSLEEIVSLDEAAFKKRFGKTSLSRAKRRGLARNALLAMGNSGDQRYAPTLKRFLDDPDEMLREQAAWSLARLSPAAQS